MAVGTLSAGIVSGGSGSLGPVSSRGVVVHGLWSRGTGLLLWFERAGAGAAGLHPDAVADPSELPGPPRRWEGRLESALSPSALRRRPELLLPGAHGVPVAVGATELRPWRVPATALAPPAAADVLHEVAHLRSTAEEGWELSPELVFLGEVASGVARWVYSGRVVPSVRGIDDEHWARWVLVDDGPLRTWRTQLAAALPPVLRAEVVQGSTVAAAELVDDLLDELTDAVVRGTLRLSESQARGAFHPLVRSLETGDPLEAFGAITTKLRTGLAEWASSSSLGAPEVLFRLLEPVEGDPEAVHEEPVDGRAGDPAAAEVRGSTWILETCLRTEDSAPVPVRSLPRSPETAGLALTALGRAMTAWPRLRRITPDVREHVVALSTADTVELVTRGAQQLRAAGIEVLLPRAWTRLDPSVALKVSSPSAAAAVTSGSVGMDQLVDYEWRLALGDVVLTPKELAALATSKAELVRLRGQWVRLDGAAVGRAARYVAGHSARGATLGQVLSELTSSDVPPVPVEEVEATGWLGDLLAAQPGSTLTTVGSPPGLRALLRPYQQRGLDWLAFMSRLGLGVVLADDMGLGKTVQLLALLLHERRAAAAPGPTLLVCPMSVVGNWQREAAQFAPDLRVLVHHGAGRRTGEALVADAATHDLVLTTYQTLARDKDSLGLVGWDRVALDEAQHVKNAATTQARAVRAMRARHRVALTGTPVENRLEDLRSVLDFANPGMLGSAQSFRARFAVPIEREHDEGAVTRLRTATRPFLLRRLKTDPTIITDLPAKNEMTVLANLTAEQAALYKAVVDEMLAKIAEAQEQGQEMARRALVLTTLTRLKQVCNHPAHFLADGSAVLRRGSHRSGKLDLVEDVLTSVLGDGEKALLFTQFRQFGDLVGPWFAERFGVEVPFLHGGVSKGRRDAMVERFQGTGSAAGDDGPPLMLLSLKAGGTGLNLTAANHVVHLDRWWNPAVENQATDRAFRIGQRKDVAVRKLVCVGTVEERIDNLISSKRELADLAVGSGEGWVTELGTDDLRELLTLGADAVGE